jgi:hypothetical protein
MATKPVVQIDGKNFVAVPQGRSERVVRRLRNEDFISQFSGEGIRSPSTFLGYQTLIFPNFSLGLGRERIDSDSARVSGEYRRFWDATCDTRFASGTYLPILEEDSTSTNLEVIRASASFKGNLWGQWEDDSSTVVRSRRYVGSSTAWTAGGDVNSAIDATSSGSDTNTSSISENHTCTGSKRLLVVGVTSQDTSTADPTGVTYNSVSMTKAGSVTNSNVTASIWYLVNPASGENSIVVSVGFTANVLDIGALSLTGIDQSAPVGTAVTATGTSTTPSVTSNATVAGEVVFDCMALNDNTAATVHTSQTQISQHSPGVNHRSGTSRELATTTSTTMSWTLGGSEAWGIVALPIKVNTSVALDVTADKNRLIAVIADENDHETYASTDGASWTAAATEIAANLLSDDVTTNEDIDAGLLASIGGEGVLAAWHEASGAITFYTSPTSDSGTTLTWADETVEIASGNGPQGLAVMAGIDNEDKLYVGTREGLHEVDTAPSTWTTRLIFPMSPNNDNCRRMKVMGDGTLWFAQGVDDDTPPIVYRMFVSNGARVIERVPNDFSLGDGLASDALGPIRWMESAGGMVYVSAGGVDVADSPTDRNARIWAHNGKGWHSMRKHGTANRKIQWIAASGDDDGTPRLHYAIRSTNTAGAYTTSTHFLGQPFTNPASGVTIKRDTPGFVDLPYVDLSFPLDIKNWLRVGVNADTLTSGTTHQHINMDYGITSDLGSLTARNGGDLGDILSGTRRLPFKTTVLGVSQEVGASGLVLGLRANMLLGSNPAANTVKPVLKDIQIDALPKPTKTRRFEVIVDIADTAALRGGANATAAIYTDLETIEDLKVKAAVTYADIGTKHMDVEAVHYDDEITGHSATGGPDSNARRGGTAQIILSEVAL